MCTELESALNRALSVLFRRLVSADGPYWRTHLVAATHLVYICFYVYIYRSISMR